MGTVAAPVLPLGPGVFLFLHSAYECAKGEHLARMCVCKRACLVVSDCLPPHGL